MRLHRKRAVRFHARASGPYVWSLRTCRRTEQPRPNGATTTRRPTRARSLDWSTGTRRRDCRGHWARRQSIRNARCRRHKHAAAPTISVVLPAQDAKAHDNKHEHHAAERLAAITPECRKYIVAQKLLAIEIHLYAFTFQVIVCFC